MEIIDLIEIYIPLLFLIYSYLLNSHAKDIETKEKPPNLFIRFGLPMYEIRWDFLFVCTSSLIIYSARNYSSNTHKDIAAVITAASLILILSTSIITIIKAKKDEVVSTYVLLVSAIILIMHAFLLYTHLEAGIFTKVSKQADGYISDILKLLAFAFILIIVLLLVCFYFILKKHFFMPFISPYLEINLQTYKHTPKNAPQKQPLVTQIIKGFYQRKDDTNMEEYLKKWDRLGIEDFRREEYNSLYKKLLELKGEKNAKNAS